jgi:integrase
LHVLPVLGKVILSDLTKHHCEKLLHAIADGITTKRQPGKRQANSARGGKGAATRTLTLLGAVLNFAVDRGYIATNPCRALRTFAVVKRDRHLDDGEYAALGQAMRNPPPATSPAMLAAVRFATLSGWRMGEVTGLRWDAIDFQRRMVVLADTKTGSSTRPLNQACIAILDAQERVPGQVLVFNPSRRQPAVYAFRATFNKLLRAAGLSGSGITPHVLRHSFVSTAGDLEQTESSIAACVGHATRSMTGRYMHRSDASLLAAADTIGRRLLVLLGDDTSEPVTVSPLPRPSAARPRLAVPEAASEAA